MNEELDAIAPGERDEAWYARDRDRSRLRLTLLRLLDADAEEPECIRSPRRAARTPNPADQRSRQVIFEHADKSKALQKSPRGSTGADRIPCRVVTLDAARAGSAGPRAAVWDKNAHGREARRVQIGS